ncbi:MAG: hypothetical protein JST17_00600 [Bacteroidetes bacterium]|nr:hypothetical protein [Bacteroidota bacterium]MBS1931784.1 hypothetical protein [Bacteroidota bacterium]
MKKGFLFALVVLLAACNSKKPGSNDSTTPGNATTQMKDINSPYPVNYSSKFVMDDPKNAETLLSLWKDWDNGDLSKSRDKFADTIEMHFSDGTIFKGSRDSILADGQRMRNTMKNVESRVDAIMAVKSTDKNEAWACLWGMEKSTDAKGKTDSSFVQETWRFDTSGRANLMYQFRAAPPKPMK